MSKGYEDGTHARMTVSLRAVLCELRRLVCIWPTQCIGRMTGRNEKVYAARKHTLGQDAAGS